MLSLHQVLLLLLPPLLLAGWLMLPGGLSQPQAWLPRRLLQLLAWPPWPRQVA